jgi:hypothetical protein
MALLALIQAMIADQKGRGRSKRSKKKRGGKKK